MNQLNEKPDAFSEQATALLTKYNVDLDKVFANIETNAYVVLLQAAKDFPNQALPAELSLVSQPSDIDTLIPHLVSDKAFMVANLRAMVMFCKAATEGSLDKYSKDDILSFYNLYKAANEADKYTAELGTARLILEVACQEISKIGKGDADLLSRSVRVFDNIISESEGRISHAYIATEEHTLFLLNMAITVAKAVTEGHDVKTASKINSLVCSLNYKMAEDVVSELTGPILRQTFKTIIPEDEFNLLEATADRLGAQLH